jgi:hypothetical protein
VATDSRSSASPRRPLGAATISAWTLRSRLDVARRLGAAIASARAARTSVAMPRPLGLARAGRELRRRDGLALQILPAASDASRPCRSRSEPLAASHEPASSTSSDARALAWPRDLAAQALHRGSVPHELGSGRDVASLSSRAAERPELVEPRDRTGELAAAVAARRASAGARSISSVVWSIAACASARTRRAISSTLARRWPSCDR